MTTYERSNILDPVEMMPIKLDIFKADNTDLKWMTRLYIESAKKEHFNINIKSRKNIAFIKRNIKSLIEKESLVDFGLETQTMIFEHQKKKIGYAVITAVRDDPDAVEIHLMVVDKKYRGKSYGSCMLKETINRWHSSVNIYARCYATSWLMKNMLIKYGFSLVNNLDDGSSLYLLKTSAPDISAPETKCSKAA